MNLWEASRPISFTVYGKPEPQGSSRAFIIAGKARITSANKKLRPFRSEVTSCAIHAVNAEGMEQPAFKEKRPVALVLTFTFRRPTSGKKRTHHVWKPDLDKLTRAVKDALTGVIYADDSQVVRLSASKVYGDVEGVAIAAEEVQQ